MLGDFNAPGINWTQFNVSTDNFYCKQKGNNLLNFVSLLDLAQHNDILNHQGNALDLCLSNMDCVRVARSEVPMVPLDRYHPALDLVLSFVDSSIRAPIEASPPRILYNFSSGDYIGMFHHLSSVDWSPVLESSDVNEQVALFTRLFQEAMERFIPLQSLKKPGFPNLFSNKLKTLLKRKDQKFKKSGLPKWEVEFKSCRKKCKIMLNRDRLAYCDSVESDLVRNPKKFWRYTRSRWISNRQ